MHFHLPRRHRRKLLLPPGLLALAGLLWLGSVVVGTWRERLMRRSVMELTMPRKPISDTIPIYQTRTLSGRGFEQPLSIPFLYSQLFTLYSWKNIRFNGNQTHDSLAALSISQNIQILRNDTIPNCGIRVLFTSNVRYKGWVKLLDLMALNHQKKYLFDIYHGPFALYVLVDDFTPQIKKLTAPEPLPFCGTMYTQMPADYHPAAPTYWSVSYLTRFNNWLAALWNPKLKDTTWYTSAVGTGTEYDISLKLETQYLPYFIHEFRQSEWRIQFLLIISMAALSWWKIKYQLQLS